MNAISADLSPAVAAVNVGAAPVTRGVTVFVAEAVPGPSLETARILMLYVVPLVRPVMVSGLSVLAGLLVTQFVPPSMEYS